MEPENFLHITNGVFLDKETFMSPTLDFSALEACLDNWTFYDRTAPEDVCGRLEGAQIAVVNKVVLDRPLLERLSDLKLIVVGATGVNNIDLEAARDAGVRVCNIRDYSTASVAQHVFALVLALATRLFEYNGAVRSGAWELSPQFCLLDFPVTELAGKVIGIVGYGALGKAVERVARAFGMEVMIAERRQARNIRTGRYSFEGVLACADVLTLHCPLSEETRGLIGAEELSRMKETAYLINTARGGIVDEQVLADALTKGTIAGAGIDVLTKEPPTDGNPLLGPGIPNLIVTPHTAWASGASIQRLIDQMAAVITDFRAGKPRNIVV